MTNSPETSWLLKRRRRDYVTTATVSSEYLDKIEKDRAFLRTQLIEMARITREAGLETARCKDALVEILKLIDSDSYDEQEVLRIAKEALG